MSHRSTSVLSAISALCVALSLTACSTAPTSEAPAPAADADAGGASDDSADPPPDLGDLSSTVCLSNGTTRDPNATVCSWNSDCKQQPYTDNADWDKHRWKKQCDAYSWMVGASVNAGTYHPEQFWCAMRPDLTTSVGGWTTIGFDSAARSSSSDWDYGYPKAECPSNQYLSGFSENTSGGGTASVANIRCVSGPSEGTNTSCHGVTFAGGYTGNVGYVDGSDDWSVGSFKLQCAGNEHMAGMSVDGNRIHGILCCSGGTPPSTSPVGASSCCNANVFPADVTACTTNPAANAGACATVDYCCQTGVSSYAGSAACAEVAFAQDPSSTAEGGTGISVGPKSSVAPTAANGVYSLFDEYANVRGNYGFGAGYDATTSLSANKSTLRTSGKTELKGYATLFGRKVTLADIEADGDSLNPSINANVNVIGMNLYNPAYSGVQSYDFEKSFTYTFFSQSKTFTVGPVPVNVSGAVAGTLGLAGTVGFSGVGSHTLSVAAGPYLDVTATASAALGGSFGPFTLEAGVDGALTLFNANVANTVTLTPGLSNVTYSANSALNLQELSGDIDLFVKGKLNLVFVKYSKKWTYTIVKFNGPQQLVTFANYNGTMAY